MCQSLPVDVECAVELGNTGGRSVPHRGYKSLASLAYCAGTTPIEEIPAHESAAITCGGVNGVGGTMMLMCF